jgi:phage shock protein A
VSVVESWREEQVEMLKQALSEANASLAALRTELTMALDRAERAEEALRVLREEIAEARRTPFG